MPDRVEVKDASGTTALRIDDTTYARTTLHQRLHGQEIVEEFTPGTRVIVGHHDGVATVVRPTHQG